MNTRRKQLNFIFWATIGLTAAGLCLQAQAAEMPKRKSGLWEISASMGGKPTGMGPAQHCIDQNSDDMMQQNAQNTKQQCSAMDLQQQGNKITIHSVCKMNATTTTTMDAVFTGAFDSAYRGDIQTRFSPPMHGMAESKMTIEAKWLGPCKLGQKAGDIVMANGRTINLNDAMRKTK